MDSLQDLLSGYSAKEPEEVAAIKRFVTETFNASCSVSVQDKTLTITVRSAALANSLRLRTLALQEACHTDKRLIFRIG